MVIWKFPLAVTDVQDIKMPRGAHVLTVQMQGDQACLWALVQPELDKARRRILIAGTGHEHESFPGNYVATFQTGPLVFHVFDLGELLS